MVTRRWWSSGLAALLLAGCVSDSDAKRPAAGQAQNMIGRQTQNEGFSAAPVKRPVRIDGVLDDWDLSGQIQSFMDIDIRDEFSVKTAAMWDPDNLYLSFDWRDPMPLNSTVDPDFDPTQGWKADAIQLRIRTPETIAWVTAWSQGKDRPNFDIAYWNDLRGDKVKGVTNRLFKGKKGSYKLSEEGVESVYKIAPDGKGFVHELKIPWKILLRSDRKIKAGDKIQMGVEFLWGDPTGRTWPIHRYADNLQKGHTSREFFWSAKDAWGDIVMRADSVPEVRRYAASGSRLEGSIPVTAEIPRDARSFSLVIEDAAGNRVRNLAGEFSAESYSTGVSGKTRTVKVMWDGLDDDGKLVSPGVYKVRGVTFNGFNAQYEMCFYNPGTPPWATMDGKGAWGADHARPEAVARSGRNMILACGFVEGGYGVWAMGPDGKKIWSEKRGMSALAANDKFVYFVPNAWDTKEPTLARLEAEKGKYAPFVRDGRALPFPYPFRQILGAADEAVPDVLNLAAGPSTLVAALPGKLVLIDAANARKIKEFKADFDSFKLPPLNEKIKTFTPLAFDGATAWYFSGNALTALDVRSGASRRVVLNPAVETPVSLALDPAGNPVIADRGRDMQVKHYTREGQLIRRYGMTGGRPSEGAFRPDGMRAMSGVAVGADGRVWVAEYSDFPRRVSVWRADGKFDRDYIGNTGYAGTGTLLHDTDPRLAYEGSNELNIDHRARTWSMASVVANPAEGRDSVYRFGSSHAQGQVFRSRASGQLRDYYFIPPYRDWSGFLVYMKEKNAWRPVSAITTVGRLAGELHASGKILQANAPAWKAFNEFDCVIWNDRNRNGAVELDECEIYPAKKKTTVQRRGELPLPMLTGWGQRMDPADLSFYAGDRDGTAWKYSPVGFDRYGAPVFSGKGLRKIADVAIDEAVPIPGENVVATFSRRNRRVYVTGLDKNTGRVLWSYPSPYHQVHGSHKATMPKPGLLIGPLKVLGVVNNCGEGGSVFMMRGNLGQDFAMTSDGIYVGSMFKDCRLPNTALPGTEAQLRGMPMTMFSMGGEPFNGWLGRQEDGVVRMTCGLAREASMILQVGGLDSIRRFSAPPVAVTDALLIRADRDNAARLSAKESVKPYRIAKVAKQPDGRRWNSIPALKIETDGQPVTGECRLAADGTTLFARFVVRDPSPWKNNGKEFAQLFKSGDCVDLQLSPSANAKRSPAEGDLRLVIAPFEGKPTAVLMRRVWKSAKPEEGRRYTSPVGTVNFAQVRKLDSVKLKVSKSADSYTVEAAIPWSELGIVPKVGMKLRGDVGFILSDELGQINTARVYWSNPATNLVNDLPLEAELHPDRWTGMTLE